MSTSKIVYKDIAPGSADNATVATSSENGFSSPTELVSDGTTAALATLELNQWALDGSRDVHNGQTVSFWSSAMSGADCAFENAPVITITFSQAYSSVGVTLMSDFPGRPSLVNVAWYQGTTLKTSKDFAVTSDIQFCEQTVVAFDKIVLTIKKTWLPRRYARLTGIVFGVIREFGMAELRNVQIVQEMHTVAVELPTSTMTWTLDNRANVAYLFQEKQPVEAWTDNHLIGVYYINQSARSSTSVYKIDCKDSLGVLDDAAFSGGFYADKSAKALFAEIVGNDFEIDFGTVTDVNLSGVIQAATKRAALQQVLFAWGVCAATDGGYKIRVFTLDDTAETIGEGRTYQGATVTTDALVTSVSVTAHSYAEDANGGVEIGGKKYTDTQTVYTVTNPNVTANTKSNEKKVTDATLVSPAIGQAVAQRVYDYYAKRDQANAKIVLDGEILGDCVTVPTPWGTTVTGNIAKMEITLSNTVAASLTLAGA
jgi:hypothetical protein|nr:MAG TPA_asm: hypothetical protein [Caudoviricetes sp.]